MSIASHPEEGVLLRYLDGELPGRKARQVRKHLEACWECRAAIEELEATVAGCVQYRKQVLQEMLPPAPAPWSDLSTGFAQIDAEISRDRWGARLGRWLAAPRVQRWAFTGAAAAAVLIGVYYQLVQTPSVRAATLLRRAVAATASHPAPARPVRMRGNYKDRTAIPAMLRAARYPAGDPLSAFSFQQWRDSLAARRDEVATVPDPETPSQSCFRIRTLAVQGDLAAASLMLRAADLHPVASRFEFRDQQWVEYSEISEGSTTDGGTPAESRMDNPTRRAVPSRPAALPSGESASVSEELRVLAALHGIGADLGDPLEIQRSNGRVLVSGVGVPPTRQREIHRALDPLPNVSIEFSDPAAAGAPGATVEMQTAAPQSPRATGVQAKLEAYLGTRAAFDRFSEDTLAALDRAMSHAYALRSLAERFPENTPMGPQDQAMLADLARSHLDALSSQINELHRTLAPVLVSLGGATAQGRPAIEERSWQQASENAFVKARRVEVLLSTLLGVTSESPNAHISADLQTAFADLRAALEDCHRLL